MAAGQHGATKKNYARHLKKHLATYARTRLGVSEAGVFDGRPYAHILPARLKYLNILEGIRAEVQEHLRRQRGVKLHKYFHHLNSSQAFAINLFFPFLGLGKSAQALTEVMGVPGDVGEWWFEHVYDKKEGTNVDVAWRDASGHYTFCEVKLSESEFGATDADERHIRRRQDVYLPKLEGLVSESFLKEASFFKHYQILRNVSLLCGNPRHRLVFLVPAANGALRAPLERALGSLSDECAKRVSVVYLESLFESLQARCREDAFLSVHVTQMMEKYGPTSPGDSVHV